MSFAQGNLITAIGLDSVNYGMKAVKAGSINTGYTYWPSSAGIYCRNKAMQFTWAWDNGIFAGGHLTLQKKEGSVWVDRFVRSYGWNTHVTGDHTTGGEGWYRVYYEGKATINFSLYWGHYPNVKGSYLKYFNDYNGSGDTPGQLLTVAAVNCGRVGTIS